MSNKVQDKHAETLLIETFKVAETFTDPRIKLVQFQTVQYSVALRRWGRETQNLDLSTQLIR